MDRQLWLDLQDWVEDVPGSVLEKRAQVGPDALSTHEKLLYCLWFANYCMMNAGDLANATARNTQFQEEAAALALELGMPRTHAAFALPTETFEARYFDLLPGIADEIREREAT